MKNNQSTDQMPPNDLAAEIAVLSSMMQDKKAAEICISAIGENHAVFYKNEHQIIYRAAFDLYKKDIAIDVLTIGSQIDAMNKLNEVQPYYLAEIIERVPSTANIDFHLKLVLDAAIDRKLILVGREITQMGFARDIVTDDKLPLAEDKIFKIRGKDNKSIITMDDLMSRCIDAIQERYDRGGGILGIDTGFTRLNNILSGMIKKEVYIVAAYPSRGKTTWALQVAKHAASIGHRVAYFSLETHDITIGHRLMAQEAKVNLADMRIGKLYDDEWNRVGMASGKISGLPLYLYDGFDRNIMTIKSKIRLLKMKYDIDMVFIDYVQLVRMPGRFESKAIEIEEVSAQLQTIAKELDVCMAPLAQFSRRSIQNNLEPAMSDLRHSGALEQDAYGIIIIHHPTDIGDKEISYRGETYVGDQLNDLVKIIVEKNKDGPTGWILNRYNKTCGLFTENVDGRDDEIPDISEQQTFF